MLLSVIGGPLDLDMGGGADAMGELLPVDLPEMMDRSPDLGWRRCHLLFGRSGSGIGSLAGEPIAGSSMRKMEHHIMVLRRCTVMWCTYSVMDLMSLAQLQKLCLELKRPPVQRILKDLVQAFWASEYRCCGSEPEMGVMGLV
ncbi:hypothetical protein ACLOJK_027264 [Asimina triloba]